MKPNNLLDISRSKSISLSHRCSVCGYRVIHSCSVITRVRTGYELFESKAAAHAEEVANSQMDAMIADIASCREKPHPLGQFCPPTSPLQFWEGIEENKIDNKTLSMTRICGLTDPCPCCGNLEPWQKTTSSKALRELEAESFPVIFEDSERAELDSVLRLQTVLEENEAVRRDPSRLEAAREANARLLAERSDLQKELQDDSAERNISSLEEQRARLADDQKAAGLLAFKAKKEIAAKIEEIDGQLDELRKQNKRKKDGLNRTLRKVDFELERYAVLFASEGAKIECVWNDSSRVMRLYTADKSEEA